MTTAPFKPLTKDDIAQVLDVSLRTIENWVNDGILPAPRKLGNRVYWHPNVFYTWLEQRLTVDDAADATATVVSAPSQDGRQKNKARAQAKPAKTELDKLRVRQQTKLDAMLS